MTDHSVTDGMPGAWPGRRDPGRTSRQPGRRPPARIPTAGQRVGRYLLLGLLVLFSVGPGQPGVVQGQENHYFVNTTADLEPQADHCTPGHPCPLRTAIMRADQTQGTVRACYDPAEVGGGIGCPEGVTPLSVADPGYEASRGRWVFEMADNFTAFDIVTGTVTIDFTRDIEGWSGPQDNRIVIHSSGGQDFAFAIQASDNLLSGFEVSGVYNVAAIELRVSATGNQLGPGLVLAGLERGVGIRMRDRSTTGNRVVGSWCGLTGDGTVVSPVVDDCIRIHRGAHGNIVGGSSSQHNVLAASATGVHLDDAAQLGTTDNVVQGNWIGLDATGRRVAGNGVGVLVEAQAHRTQIRANVIAGNEGAGVLVQDQTYQVVIEDNLVGTDPAGQLVLGNTDWGIRVQGGPKDGRVTGNLVTYNARGGVLVGGVSTRGILVTRNRITANGGPAVAVVGGANGGLQPPRLFSATATEVFGQACGGCTVEIYSDPAGQAAVFEGSIGTDVAFGQFRFVKPEPFTYGSVTALALDGNGNTSGISEPVYLPGHATPTPTGGPTPAPTPTGGPGWRIHLPWLARSAWQ